MIQVDTIYQGKGIQDWKKKRGWGSIKCACLCLICHVEFFTGRSITNRGASIVVMLLDHFETTTMQIVEMHPNLDKL